MDKYEEETGKKAIWRDSITEGFKKWQRGEEIYGKDKKGISILVSDETKSTWQAFAKLHDFSTVSKLIRKSVEFYMENNSFEWSLLNVSRISYALKGPLTTIQGFSQLIITNEADEINPDTLSKIREIYEQSLSLEEIIDQLLTNIESETLAYDIIYIEDDESTQKVMIEFFKSKGFTCLGVSTGSDGIEEINRSIPKMILLDIILPDKNGYDICKMLKSNIKTKDIPIYFITALPENEVRDKIDETGADGYILKPFKLHHFNEVLKKLKS